MGTRVFQVVKFWSFAFFTVYTQGKICEKLDSALFSTCVNAGLNTTIVGTSNPGKDVIISSLTGQTITELGRCSPFIDFMICSVSVPKCIEGVYQPILPCRRVCEDVVRGCDVHRVRNGNVEWLKGLCKLLPDEDSKSVKCIEPKGFKPLHRKAKSNEQIVDSTGSKQVPAIHIKALTVTFSVVTTFIILTTVIHCYMKKRRIFYMRGYWRHSDEQEEEMAVIVTS
ncbi:hypothetical protein QZH41_011363 [Actinostola sp. cb2023]|nr:hypothetical protein QZH41_011363 [Actinostola sp. cb2023]